MKLLTQVRAVSLCRGAFRLKPAHIQFINKLQCCRSFAIAKILQSHITSTGKHASVQNTSYNTALGAHTSFFRKHVCGVYFVPRRCKMTGKESRETSEKKSLVQARESPYAGLTAGQKVKEAGKDVSYGLVIIVGLGVTGFLFYMIGKELFSSDSASGVYGDALKKCQANMEVAAALGEPIKGYGETTRRGRRRHVSHTEFEVNGVPHMRMRFYVEGPYKKGTVHVEVQKGESGKFEYRYLVVETEGYPHRTFVLEDNRQKTQQLSTFG